MNKGANVFPIEPSHLLYSLFQSRLGNHQLYILRDRLGNLGSDLGTLLGSNYPMGLAFRLDVRLNT